MDSKEIETAIAKKSAQEAAKPIRDRINPATGKVLVFLIHEQKEREVFPVDAREMISSGHATFDAVAVVKGKDTLKVCSSKLHAYLDEGYELVGIGKSDNGGGNKTIDFKQFKVAELHGFADNAGIKDHEEMKKEALIASLIAANYVPPADNGGGN